MYTPVLPVILYRAIDCFKVSANSSALTSRSPTVPRIAGGSPAGKPRDANCYQLCCGNAIANPSICVATY